MKEMQDKKIVKWQSEIEVLEELKKDVQEFAELKDQKGEKDKIDRLNAKIADIIENNFWTRLEWSTIKRGKQSRAEGLEKIEKKIKDRVKKIEAQKKAIEEAEEPLIAKDWDKYRDECTEGDKLFHWAYGEMEVMAVEGEYLFMKVLDKKGCKLDWLGKNNAEVITIDGDVEQVKEFPKDAIGRWLFPDKEDVQVEDKTSCHKIFR